MKEKWPAFGTTSCSTQLTAMGTGGGQMTAAVQCFYRAYTLDRSEPTSIVLILRQYNEKYALHQTWRWVNGWLLSRVFASPWRRR